MEAAVPGYGGALTALGRGPYRGEEAPVQYTLCGIVFFFSLFFVSQIFFTDSIFLKFGENLSVVK